MDHRAALLSLAWRFARATNRSVARVSTMAANDGKFFRKIEAGAGCTFGRFDRIVQWFSDNWPADIAWPQDIVRPAPAPSTTEAA